MKRVITAATAILIGALLAGALAVLTSSASASRPGAPTILTATFAKDDGHLVYGIGAVSASHGGGDGSQFVTFNQDVSHCAYSVQTGDYPGDGYAGPDDGVSWGIAPSDTDVNSVFIMERDDVLGYETWSTPGHVIVVC